WPSCSTASESLLTRPTHGQAAVDDQLLPCHVGGVVAREEADGSGALVRRADAPPRDDASGRLKPFLAERVLGVEGLRTLNEPRDDRIDPDATGCQFDGERACQPEHARLCRRVVRVLLPAVDAARDR